MRRLAVVLLGILLLSAVVSGGVAAESQAESVSGAAVPLPADVENQYREFMQDAADRYGYEPRGEVFLLYEDGVTYIVSSNTLPTAGVATVAGEVVEPRELGTDDIGVVFAKSVDVSRSGEAISAAELQTNTQSYAGRVVEVTAPYRELSFLTDAEAVQTRHRIGAVGGESLSADIGLPPGRAARFMAVNASSPDRADDPILAAGTRVAFAASGEANLTGAYKATSWWMETRATVSILVLPEAFVGGVRSLDLYVLDAEPVSEATVSPAELRASGDSLVGETVTVEGAAVGTRISAQESLLSVAECAPESITIPASPAACIPIPGDVAIHTGGIVDPDVPAAVVPYVGLSNQYQDVTVTAERGRYRLTGRVVSAEKLGPNVTDGYALLVYDRERVGGLSVGSALESTLEARANNLTDRLQTQLYLTHSEYEVTEQRAQATPTPTPSSSPTATAVATPTPTAKPAAGGNSATGSDARNGEQRDGEEASTPIVKTDQIRDTPTESGLAKSAFSHVWSLLKIISVLSLFIGPACVLTAVIAGGLIRLKRWNGDPVKDESAQSVQQVGLVGVLISPVGGIIYPPSLAASVPVVVLYILYLTLRLVYDSL